MITYTCPKCGISSERSICGKCGGRTDAESHLYWCPTCKVPLYGKNCENCGQEGVEFAADVRPVFPEERLLIEVLLGKPLAFIDGSVWASAGDRYYVDGKKIVFSTIKHSEADADEVRRQWNEWSSRNNYEAFDRYAERFIRANRTRLDYIEMEAMQYIQEAAKGFDAGTMFVSFSGGKDSTVVSDLVMRALGRSDVLHIFGNTTLEFPQTIDYVSEFRKDHPTTPMLRAENRQQDFYTLCELFGPPSRMLRWCCTIFKTGYIGDKIKRTFADAKQVLVFNGIRRNESTSRSKYDRDNTSPKISKQKTASPIIDWFDFDIWLYLLSRKIRFNEAYRLGYSRVGCWMCPNNNRWAQFLSRVYLPEESKRFNKMLYDFAVKQGKADPEEYVRNNGWKARSGGAGVELSKKVAIDFKPCATDSKSFLYELNRPITQELYEFFKPFGILNFDMGNARLGEVYVLDAHKKVPLLKLQGRQGTNTLRITVMSTPVAGRTKMVEIDQKLKCQITKYQMCVGCHACENACRFNAITLIKRGQDDSDYQYRVDEKKCVHCFECISHYNGGCYMRRVLLPRGKDYVEK